jgi:hypothetical protein
MEVLESYPPCAARAALHSVQKLFEQSRGTVSCASRAAVHRSPSPCRPSCSWRHPLAPRAPSSSPSQSARPLSLPERGATIVVPIGKCCTGLLLHMSLDGTASPHQPHLLYDAAAHPTSAPAWRRGGHRSCAWDLHCQPPLSERRPPSRDTPAPTSIITSSLIIAIIFSLLTRWGIKVLMHIKFFTMIWNLRRMLLLDDYCLDSNL